MRFQLDTTLMHKRPVDRDRVLPPKELAGVTIDCLDDVIFSSPPFFYAAHQSAFFVPQHQKPHA